MSINVIDWTPVLERLGPIEVGYRAEEDRRWIEAHTVVLKAENAMLLRYTTAHQLTELLSAVVQWYGRLITSTTSINDGGGKKTSANINARWFAENQIIVTLGSPSSGTGIRKVGIAFVSVPTITAAVVRKAITVLVKTLLISTFTEAIPVTAAAVMTAESPTTV